MLNDGMDSIGVVARTGTRPGSCACSSGRRGPACGPYRHDPPVPGRRAGRHHPRPRRRSAAATRRALPERRRPPPAQRGDHEGTRQARLPVGRHVSEAFLPSTPPGRSSATCAGTLRRSIPRRSSTPAAPTQGGRSSRPPPTLPRCSSMTSRTPPKLWRSRRACPDGPRRRSRPMTPRPAAGQGSPPRPPALQAWLFPKTTAWSLRLSDPQAVKC